MPKRTALLSLVPCPNFSSLIDKDNLGLCKITGERQKERTNKGKKERTNKVKEGRTKEEKEEVGRSVK